MPKSLPVYSVDTIEQAEDLQIVFCRRAYDGRYIMTDFAEQAEIDAMGSIAWAADKMRSMNERRKENLNGQRT